MKRISVIAGGLVLGGLLVWQFVFLGNPPRTILFPPPSDPPIPAVLDELSSVDVYDVPLDTVVAELAKRHGTTIQLDLPGLKREGITGAERVTCRLKNVSLRSILRHVTRNVTPALCVVSWNGVVTITTQAEQSMSSHRIEHLHSFAESLESGSNLDPSAFGYVLENVLPWMSVREQLAFVPGGILASVTAEEHARLAELLQKLAAIARQPNSIAPVRVGEVRTPAVAAIERALARRISLKFVNVTLSEVARDLERRLGVPVFVDEFVLRVSGVSDPRISGAIADASAEYALDHLLRPYGLQAVLRDEALSITLQDVEDAHLRLYPVADLANRLGDSAFEFPSILERNDRGSVRVFGTSSYPIPAAALIVHSTPQGHRHVERLLAELRHAAFGTPVSAATGPRAWLRQRVTVKRDNVRWEDLLNELAAQYGFAFRVDHTAYESAMLDPPVSVAVEDEPLIAALDRVLRPMELGCTSDEERLVIASIDEVAVNETRFYRPHALFAGHSIEPTNEDWREAIQTIFPDVYHEPIVFSDVIALSLGGNEHERVTAFFDACRRLSRPGPHAIVTLAQTSDVIVRLYPVADLPGDTRRLESLATELLTPGESSVTWLPEILIVSGHLADHQEIERLLAALRAWPSRPAGVQVRSTVLDDDRFAALQKRVTLARRNEPLAEIVAALATQQCVPLNVANGQSKFGGSSWLIGARLEQGLDRLLRQHGLGYGENASGRIDDLPPGENRFTRLYDVADLRPAARRPGLAESVLLREFSIDALREHFPAVAPSQTVWDVLSSAAAINTNGSTAAVLHGDRLVVRGRLGFHRLVERLLADERRGSAAPSPNDPWVALRQPVSLDCDGLTVGEAVERLARLVGVPVGYLPHPPQSALHLVDPFAVPDDKTPRATLHFRDLPFREIVRRLYPPPYDLDVVVEDEMLVVERRGAAEWGPRTEVHDARRIIARHPALADAALADLLCWTIRPGVWRHGTMTVAMNVAGRLVVNGDGSLQIEVSDWLAWLEHEAPQSIDLNTGRSDATRSSTVPFARYPPYELTGVTSVYPPVTSPKRPRDVERLLRQAHGDAGPWERGYAFWRLSHWSAPDDATMRTVLGWLKGCDGPSDWERQLCHLVSGWGLPEECAPWVAERLGDRKFASRQPSYVRLLISSGTAGQAAWSGVLRRSTKFRLRELLDQTAEPDRNWLWQPVPGLLADWGQPSSDEDQARRFADLVKSLGHGFSGFEQLQANWQKGSARERALAARIDAVLRGTGN